MLGPLFGGAEAGQKYQRLNSQRQSSNKEGRELVDKRPVFFFFFFLIPDSGSSEV